MSNPQIPPSLQASSPIIFWDETLSLLARELSPQQFKTWIQPLKLGSFLESEQLLTITAPNRFKLDWIKKTFADRFQALAAAYFATPITLNFVLEIDPDAMGRSPSTADTAPVAVGVTANDRDPSVGLDDEELVGFSDEHAFDIEDHSKLNPALTFDTFVTGKANHLARAASIQVAHNPGT